MDKDPELEAALLAFNAEFNRHGYGFPFAVLRRARELRTNDVSRFYPELVEFPVAVQGNATRIDFILRYQSRHANDPERFYLVCECKRANPALANWCFARAPFIRRGRSNEPLLIERVSVQRHRTSMLLERATSLNDQIGWSFDAANIALEVRHSEKGDTKGSKPGAIEDAATQVMRGVNGFIEFSRASAAVVPFEGGVSASIMPVIFTTAKLYLSSADLYTTDLATGKIDLSSAGFERKKWIGLQYHQSPLLKHEAPWFDRQFSDPRASPEDLGTELDEQFVRTIAIVSADGIEDSLKWCTQLND